MLVRFSCGCVGFEIRDSVTQKTLIVSPCDHDQTWDRDSNIDLQWRDMNDKDYEIIDHEEQMKHFNEIFKLVHEGHQLREVKVLLK